MISIDKQKLLSGFAPMAKVTTSKSHPIYEYVLIECKKGEDVLHLTCTNGDLTVISRIQLTECAEKDFCTCVQAKLFGDMLRSLPNGEVVLGVNDKDAFLDWGTGKSTLFTAESADFPNTYLVSDPLLKGDLRISGLRQALKSVAKATADEDFGRPALSSVFFDSKDGILNVVASDSHQLVCGTLPSTLPDGNILLPDAAAHLLFVILVISESNVVEMTSNNSHVRFDTEDFSIISTLVKAKFPNYRAVIPENPAGRLYVEKEQILHTAKRAAIFCNKSTGSIGLEFNPGKIRIYSEELAYGMSLNETVYCEYDGPSINMMVKAEMMIDVLSIINADRIEIGVTEAMRPLRIQPEKLENKDESQVAVIMPTAK